jgi:hypothetical protein
MALKLVRAGFDDKFSVQPKANSKMSPYDNLMIQMNLIYSISHTCEVHLDEVRSQESGVRNKSVPHLSENRYNYSN